MKFLSVSVLLLAQAAAGVAAELAEVKEPRAEAAPITVYTHFDQECSAVSLEEMKAELSTIMSPIGLSFEWRSLDAARGNEVAVELVVVNFKGKCEMEDMVSSKTEPGALGWTHMSDGDVLPFSDVECDRIRRFINPLVGAKDPERRQAILGRAMGRVLAHEFYHIFTNTTRHASRGVAKAFYSAGELVSEKFEFQSRETGTLRNGRLRQLIGAASPAPAPSGQ